METMEMEAMGGRKRGGRRKGGTTTTTTLSADSIWYREMFAMSTRRVAMGRANAQGLMVPHVP